MPFFKRWVNFVVHPSKPGCICSLKERLDTSQAVDPRSAEYQFGMKAIIYEHDVFSGYDDDELEVMEIGEYGSVTIWTKYRVCEVRNEAGQVERLKCLPRNPPPTAGALS